MQINRKKLLPFLLSVSFLVGCSMPNAAEEPELLEPVRASEEYATVIRGDLSNRVYYEAYVEPRVVTAAFVTDGMIGEIYKSIGDEVKKGDKLATFDLSDVEDERKTLHLKIGALKGLSDMQAQMKFKESQIDLAGNIEKKEDARIIHNKLYEAEEELSKLKAYNPDEVTPGMEQYNVTERIRDLQNLVDDLRESEQALLKGATENHEDFIKEVEEFSNTDEFYDIDLREYQHRLSELDKKEQMSTLLSPCDGTVILSLARDYELLSDGVKVPASDPIYYIAKEDEKFIASKDFPEKRWKSDMEAYALVDGVEYPLKKADYESNFKSDMKSKSKKKSITYDLPCLFEFEDAGIMDKLSLGDYVSLVISKETKRDTLYVMRDAVYSDTSGKYVKRVTENGTERVDVECGMTSEYDVELLSGVNEGDVLVTKNTYFATKNKQIVTLSPANHTYEDHYKIVAASSSGKLQRLFCEFDQARLEEVYVKEGQLVKAGDVVAKFALYENDSEISDIEYGMSKEEQSYTRKLVELEKQKENLIKEQKRLVRDAEGNENDNAINSIDRQLEYIETAKQEAVMKKDYNLMVANDKIDSIQTKQDKAYIVAKEDGVVTNISNSLIGTSLVKDQEFGFIALGDSPLFKVNDNGELHYGMVVSIDGYTGKVIASQDVLPPWICGKGDGYLMPVLNSLSVIKPVNTIPSEGTEKCIGREVTATLAVYPKSYEINRKMLEEDDYGYYLYVTEGDSREKKYVTLSRFDDDTAYVLDGLTGDCPVLSRE